MRSCHEVLLKPLLTGVIAIIMITACSLHGADNKEFYIIPFKVDPPIQIDGNLQDWNSVPGAMKLRGAPHVTWGKNEYKGTEDLHAIVQLSWRHDGIYLVADVIDDVVQQPFSGKNVWKGDYINLWLDMTPSADQGRDSFGKGQYHIAISPGNIGKGGKPVPEVYVYKPQGVVTKKICKVVSRKTAKGYIVEAFIPFSILGVKAVKQNQIITFEIAVSDSDDQPSRQQSIITFGTKKWALRRSRLIPMVFGDGNGKGNVPFKRMVIAKTDSTIQAKKTTIFKFKIDEAPSSKAYFLSFNARADFPTAGGYCTGNLTVKVNGVQLDEDRICNRFATENMKNGGTINIITVDGRLTPPWAPDFASTDKHKQYGITGKCASKFEFALDGLLKKGENSIIFKNVGWLKSKPEIVVGNVELFVKPRLAGGNKTGAAPSGDLPVYEPQKEFTSTYSDLANKNDQISFVLNNKKYLIKSRFSTPGKKWHTKSNKYFKLKRSVIKHKDWFEIRDSIRNLTDKNLPVMLIYDCSLGKNFKKAWLGGNEIAGKYAKMEKSANPSVFAVNDKSGIGMVALNDIFRVHLQQYVSGSFISLSDRNLVIKPGAEYTIEIAVVPTVKPDFWLFVNTARRLLDVNFTLKYMFAFLFKDKPTYKWSDGTFKAFVNNKSANFVVRSLYGVKTKDGHPARCTDWLSGSHTSYIDFVKRVHRLFPDGKVKTGVYFHCFLDTTIENAKRFADDRGLDINGKHIQYGAGKRHSYMKLFYPTLDNQWGKEISKVIDCIFGEIGADGVFWDEFTHSTGKYIYNKWDGCSADIDWATFKIKKLKGSLTLLSRNWRLKQVKRIRKQGPLVINGAPITRTLANMKIQSFTESGNISHLNGVLLYSPIALGDHLTEKKPIHAYKMMLRALNHGCLYAWYSIKITPKYKMLTEYMYPFTPIEIHSGYVIGKERILSNRCGLFGWGDNSDFEAHVFNREGRKTDKYKVRKVERDGRSYAEVRIPGGYSVAIVKK